MARIGMHVFAWLSVAAYLFANTHTSWAVAALLAKPAEATADAPAKSTCCRHCQSRHAKPTPPQDRDNDDRRSCPCCPDPSQCPDDCALCSVAQLPITVASPMVVVHESCLVECWAEPDDLHFISVTGELMRPPRA